MNPISESARLTTSQADQSSPDSFADGTAGKLATSHSIAVRDGVQDTQARCHLPSKPVQRDLLHTRAQAPCFLCGAESFGVPWMFVALLRAKRPAIIREVCARCAGDLRYAKPEARTRILEERAPSVFEEVAA